MKNSFLFSLPNTNYEIYSIVFTVLIVIIVLGLAVYTSMYHKVKQKTAITTIKNISELPQQILKKQYQKDKKKIMSIVGDDFCSLFTIFLEKRDIDIGIIVNKMGKKDFLSKLYKSELSETEETKLKKIILELEI